MIQCGISNDLLCSCEKKPVFARVCLLASIKLLPDVFGEQVLNLLLLFELR